MTQSNTLSIQNTKLYYTPNEGVPNLKNFETNCTKATRCWNCWDTLSAQKKYISVPFSRTTQNEFVFHGKFCSLGCAKRHILNKWSHQSLIKMIWLNEAAYEKFKIPNADVIPPAPPPESLIEMGGCLTRQQYREKIKEGACMQTITYPLITFPIKVYEEEKCVEDAAQVFASEDQFEQFVNSKIQSEQKSKVKKPRTLSSKDHDKTTKRRKKTVVKELAPSKKRKKVEEAIISNKTKHKYPTRNNKTTKAASEIPLPKASEKQKPKKRKAKQCIPRSSVKKKIKTKRNTLLNYVIKDN